MIANMDPELWEWLCAMETEAPANPDFLSHLAAAGLRADARSYGVLRPVLLIFRDLHPAKLRRADIRQLELPVTMEAGRGFTTQELQEARAALCAVGVGGEQQMTLLELSPPDPPEDGPSGFPYGRKDDASIYSQRRPRNPCPMPTSSACVEFRCNDCESPACICACHEKV